MTDPLLNTLGDEVCRHLALLDDSPELSRAAVRVDPLQTLPHSEVYRIRSDPPERSLILKRAGASDVAGLADRERRFYRHIAPGLPRWLVPACVLTVEDAQSEWLLIEDLSSSHRPVANPTRPSRHECRQLVESLGTLHGLTASAGEIRDRWTRVSADLPAATIDARIDFFLTVLDPFISTHAHRLDQPARTCLERLRDLGDRVGAAAPRTALVHGDAHFGNALFSAASTACLIDWGMPMIGFGEIDLAHALALNLPRRVAREWEPEMIDAYLTQAGEYGSPLEADDVHERYRTGVLYSLVSPIVWWRSGVPETVWWPAMVNALDAARDLDLM